MFSSQEVVPVVLVLTQEHSHARTFNWFQPLLSSLSSFGKDIGCRSVPFPSSLPPAILNQGARVTYVPTYQTDGFGLLCLDAHSNVPRFTYQNSPSESKGLFLLNREICNDCNDASVQASKKLEVAALLYLASHLFRQHKLQGTLMPARVDGI